ncbi:MAG: tRNA1(Val) (adenine(37)-N6)-methyltransferase [Myxococcales bacterium]|nr:tRNA1(Val) (adenine(37)-N6)-methyltransferase [Myxococcales bacterium]
MVQQDNQPTRKPFVTVPVHDDEDQQELLRGALVILQKKEGYRFSVDPILLTAFMEINQGDRVLDLGTGTGVMPIILANRNAAKDAAYTGLEIMETMADMARRSVQANRFENRIQIQLGDIREIKQFMAPDSYDVVISNPPYIPFDAGNVNPDDLKAIARHEVLVTLPDIVGAARHVLKSRGRAYFVYPVYRLIDLVALCREHNLEPRQIQFVHANQASSAKLVLVEAVRDAGTELKVLRPIIVYNMEGGYTEEVAEILNEHDTLE